MAERTTIEVEVTDTQDIKGVHYSHVVDKTGTIQTWLPTSSLGSGAKAKAAAETNDTTKTGEPPKTKKGE